MKERKKEWIDRLIFRERERERVGEREWERESGREREITSKISSSR